jgi:hypothetical protein
MQITKESVTITLNHYEIEALKLMAELFVNSSANDIARLAPERGNVVSTRGDAVKLASQIFKI